MATALRTDNPYSNRASRTVRRAIGTSVTGVATTDVFTLVGSPTLDTIENHALVRIEGTFSGGAGLTPGEYFLTKISGTTFKLSSVLYGPDVNITSDLTSGATLWYGLRTYAEDGLLAGDIATPA